jgi:hypothetical protein
MIRLHRFGSTTVIRDEIREIQPREVRLKIIRELYAQGLTQNQIADVFRCNQASISRSITEYDPDVTPLFGSGEWTPEDQDQSPATCNRCGGDNGSIRRGSRLYCAACHKSGYDARMAERRVRDKLRETAEDIQSEGEAIERKPKRSLAQRRNAKRA